MPATRRRDWKVELIGKLLPDADVKGVARLCETDGPGRLVRDLSETVDVSGLGGETIAITVVKQRLGQRAVLHVKGFQSGEAQQSFYVKLLRHLPAEEARVSLCKLADAAETVGVQVPRPVAVLPRFRALVMEELPGEPLLDYALTCGAGAVEAFLSAGRALARLHRVLDVSGPLRGREFERAQIERARPTLIRCRPDLITMYDAGLNRWLEETPAVAGTPASLHGDFYPAQVLYKAPAAPAEAATLAILDWDNVCPGDAERDVGNFEAHLILERLRGSLGEQAVAHLLQAFRTGNRSVGELTPDLAEWYRRGSVLRLAALHAEPDFGAAPPNDPRLPELLLESN